MPSTTVLAIFLSILLPLSIWVVYRICCTGDLKITEELERGVLNTQASVDDLVLQTVLDDADFVGLRPHHFQSKLITLAKSEFGLLKRTEANRLMVRKFMRDHMREHGVRPSHIAAHLDKSVAIFFIPTKMDIEAVQVGATSLAHERNNRILADWQSFFGRIGGMLGFTKQ